MGSPRTLNEVLSRTGTPVRFPKATSSSWNNGSSSRSTVCTRADPSTCVTPGSLARRSLRTGNESSM
jgi:hypothetical protein